MAQNELMVQIAVVNWLKYNFPKMLYCASAGGMRTSLSVAKKMKASGYVKGMPDLQIMHPTKKPAVPATSAPAINLKNTSVTPNFISRIATA